MHIFPLKAFCILPFLILFVTRESLAKPAKEKRIFNLNLDGNALNNLLGIGLAGGAGLLLGQALGGLGRENTFGRRRNNVGFGGLGGFPGLGGGFGGGFNPFNPFGGFGKRNTKEKNDDPFDKTEENLISSMFELMMRTDPNECYEKLICEAATKEDEFESLHPFLNFASNTEDLFVPKSFLSYSKKLKAAKRLGEGSGNHEACEDEYQCPFTGMEMNNAMKEKFQDDVAA